MISKNGDSYDTYTKTTLTDTKGNTLYKYIDSDNNSHYIAAVADTDKGTTSYYDVTESTRTAYTDADGKELEAVPTGDGDTTLKVGDKTYKRTRQTASTICKRKMAQLIKLIPSLFHKRPSTLLRQMP